MWFSGSLGSAWGSSGAVVAVFGVDGEGADDFAGGVVDDADVVAGDEHDDAGSIEGSAEADVVHVAVDSEAECPLWIRSVECRLMFAASL